MNIHKTVQNNHRNTPCFFNVTTLTSFRRGMTGKNGFIVLMPHGESLREYYLIKFIQHVQYFISAQEPSEQPLYKHKTKQQTAF